ncbi:hypothetical protein [Curvibacter lanceolatus]|uniref:hypothetical protein n=1 Tax=Curvibacter lanceolatus TaxID=86182 RepID=UPI0012F84DD9|nr:hypothetical protein [Curvibacter lanceolatus]
MRTLFVLSNMTFPPREGAHAQTLNLIKVLQGKGVEISLILFLKNRSSFDLDGFNGSYHGVNVISVFLDARSYSYRFLVFSFLRLFRLHRLIYFKFFKVIDRVSNDVDLIHAEGVPLVPLLCGSVKKPLVMSVVDAWSLRQNRLAKFSFGISKIQRRFSATMSRYAEKFYLPKANVVHLVSPDDSSYLRGVSSRINLIDIPVMREIPNFKRDALPREGKSILILGDISLPFIRDGILEFFANLSDDQSAFLGGIRFYVLGRVEPDSELVSSIPSYLNFTFLRWVPNIDEEIIKHSAILLLDKSGTGLKNRVIDAMICKIPLIASVAAVEGIGVVNNIHCCIFNDYGSIVDAMKRVVSDCSFSENLRISAYNLFLSNYSSNVVGDRWVKLYLNLKG